MRIGIIFLGWICFQTAFSKEYQVGPTREFKKLQDITNSLKPGDVVSVDGGVTYPCGVSFDVSGTENNRITIQGIKEKGKRPLLTGNTRLCMDITANYLTLKGFEITGGTKAAIGHYAHEIVISDFKIHDVPRNGILGYGSNSGSLTLEYTEIYNSGWSAGTPYAHQIYMATDEKAYPNAVFRMQYCYLHSGNGGNNVKTRAGRNEFYYNWLETSAFHTLELIGPDAEDNSGVNESTKREDSDIVGNVILCQTNMACARIGGDGTGQTKGRYRFVNNTFVLQGKGDAIRMYDGVESIELHNNVFFNKLNTGTITIIDEDDGNWVNGRVVGGGNNWIQSGAANIPSSTELLKTIKGDDPGFVDGANNNFNLALGSKLIGGGKASPPTISAHPFLNPLLIPVFQPEEKSVPDEGKQKTRLNGVSMDIGAYEYLKKVSIQRSYRKNQIIPVAPQAIFNVLGQKQKVNYSRFIIIEVGRTTPSTVPLIKKTPEMLSE